MNRLTWSGVALHAGNLPGYPASHGCVRLPLAFSELLFGITKLGMTVVIADENSQPDSVVHPGMVLGDYAKREFAAVDTAVKRHQYSQGRVGDDQSTSVVVSRKDKSIIVWENGKVVARGQTEIESPNQPLGERAYTLTKVSGKSGELTWVSASYSSARRSDDASTLRRIKAYPAIRREIEKRMHQGMTLVTSDGSANSQTTATDFTVMTGLF